MIALNLTGAAAPTGKAPATSAEKGVARAGGLEFNAVMILPGAAMQSTPLPVPTGSAALATGLPPDRDPTQGPTCAVALSFDCLATASDITTPPDLIPPHQGNVDLTARKEQDAHPSVKPEMAHTVRPTLSTEPWPTDDEVILFSVPNPDTAPTNPLPPSAQDAAAPDLVVSDIAPNPAAAFIPPATAISPSPEAITLLLPNAPPTPDLDSRLHFAPTAAGAKRFAPDRDPPGSLSGHRSDTAAHPIPPSKAEAQPTAAPVALTDLPQTEPAFARSARPAAKAPQEPIGNGPADDAARSGLGDTRRQSLVAPVRTAMSTDGAGQSFPTELDPLGAHFQSGKATAVESAPVARRQAAASPVAASPVLLDRAPISRNHPAASPASSDANLQAPQRQIPGSPSAPAAGNPPAASDDQTTDVAQPALQGPTSPDDRTSWRPVGQQHSPASPLPVVVAGMETSSPRRTVSTVTFRPLSNHPLPGPDLATAIPASSDKAKLTIEPVQPPARKTPGPVPHGSVSATPAPVLRPADPAATYAPPPPIAQPPLRHPRQPSALPQSTAVTLPQPATSSVHLAQTASFAEPASPRPTAAQPQKAAGTVQPILKFWPGAGAVPEDLAMWSGPPIPLYARTPAAFSLNPADARPLPLRAATLTAQPSAALPLSSTQTAIPVPDRPKPPVSPYPDILTSRRTAESSPRPAEGHGTQSDARRPTAAPGVAPLASGGQKPPTPLWSALTAAAPGQAAAMSANDPPARLSRAGPLAQPAIHRPTHQHSGPVQPEQFDAPAQTDRAAALPQAPVPQRKAHLTPPRTAEPDLQIAAPPITTPPPFAAPPAHDPGFSPPQHLTALAVQSPPVTTSAPYPASPDNGHVHALPRHLPAALAKAASQVGKDDRIELLLDPVELGRVRFELTPNADRVQVNVSVERPETLDLMRRNIETLRAEFRNAGFDGATLSFSQWGKGGDPAPDTTFAPPDQVTDPPAEEPAFPAQPARNTSRHGLDLRL